MLICRLLCLAFLCWSVASASRASYRQYSYKWWDVVVAPQSAALKSRQQKLLQKVKGLIDIVRLASKHSLNECTAQLSGRRWNCSRTPNPYRGRGPNRVPAPYFGTFLDFGTREAGYVHALLSAGLLYHMLQNFNSFAIPKDWRNFEDNVSSKPAVGHNHSPLNNRDPRDITNSLGDDLKSPPGKYTCSLKSFKQCLELAKHFTDLSDRSLANDSGRKLHALMNRHNNEVGRQAVLKKGQRKKCRCTGLSASCTMTTCYKMLDFKGVAKYLKNQYLKSVEVETAQDYISGDEVLVITTQQDATLKGSGKLLQTRDRFRHQPSNTSIVHILTSPNFCNANSKFDLPGTSGRACNATAPRSGGCQRLCCGRGHETVMVQRNDCKCKYHHCCHIVCDKCIRPETRCL